MTDLTFKSDLTWAGLGKEGEGKLQTSEETMIYSSPASMGGKGVGVSPEDLLVSAVASCYSGTLFALLKKKKLPVKEVQVRAEGRVAGFPLQSAFNQLIVYPTVIGGIPSEKEAYETAARKARDKCFIGKTISGNVDYQVGDVQIKEG